MMTGTLAVRSGPAPGEVEKSQTNVCGENFSPARFDVRCYSAPLP